MKKYKKLSICIGAILIVVTSFFLGLIFFKKASFNESNVVTKQNENTLSIMLEQTAGAGDYVVSSQSTWPTDGYIFNSELSNCKNGSKLIWNDTKKTVIYKGNLTDKCFIYFDIVPPSKVSDVCSGGENLASCIKTLSDIGGASNTNIYYHDSNLTNGAGDNSYRYAGASSSVNNYVCFGSEATTCPEDNLYRIIGVFGDQVKLIKSTSLGNMAWDDSNTTNTWSTASLNIYLNETYLTSLGTYASKIAQTTWKVGGNTWANIASQIVSVAYQNEIVNPVTTNTTDNATTFGPSASSKIGLMYVSDYLYAAGPDAWTKPGYSSSGSSYDYRSVTGINWLFSGTKELTISRCADYSDNVFLVYSSGVVESDYVDDRRVGNGYAVRPVFYLESSATYSSGDGTSNNPIRLG